MNNYGDLKTMNNMIFIPLNNLKLDDIINALAGNGDNWAKAWNDFIEPCEKEFKEMGQPSLKIPADKANSCWANGTPQYKEPNWNGDKAFALANDIKARKAKIEELKEAQAKVIENEQKALEEAEKQYRAELSHIRYVGDDKQLQLLIPREKMFQLIQGLTKVINENKEAKSYRVTINL